VRIWIDGGLGNQLFQFTFAHYLKSTGHDEIDLFPDPNPRPDRPLLLNRFIDACSHLEIVDDESNKQKGNLIFRILRKLRGNKFISEKIAKLIELFFVLETTEFTFMKKIKRKKKTFQVVGYFQNWRYLKPNWEEISEEMNRCLSEVKLPGFTDDFFSKETELVVLHFRIGDLARSYSTMGILNESYYKNILDGLRKLTEKELILVAITDDVLGSETVMGNIKIHRLIGPNDLNELECFKLMSLADIVISANSTFSWWGAMLATSNGGIGYIPKPWFKNWATEIGDAFEFPGLKTSHASFVENLNFKSKYVE
jgi:hypothetical protein